MKKLEDLQRELSEGRLTRREFIARTTALGLAAAVPSLVLTEEARAAAPKRGGRMRLAITGGATSDVLDPALTLDSYMINVNMGQLRNCLTEINGKGELVGELAESWESTPDAKQWMFKLRKGVEFHNGKSLEAADVVYTIQHHLGPDSKSAAKGIVTAIQEVKADGKDTVVFSLSGGSADFPYLMSDYHLVIFPDGTTAADHEKGIGTGGYRLQSFEPGVRTLVTHNPNYWKPNSAWFDEVETLQIADINASTNALRTGQIDVNSRVELKTVHLLAKSPGIKILQTNGTKHCTLPMDTKVAPFDNNDVRLALKYAIDRESWLKTLLRGYGALGNDHPIGSANQFHATAAELPQRQYDPDKAKFHLKKAGLDKLSVNLSVADTAFAGAVDGATLYRETAAKGGIDLEIVREPDDGYWDNVWLKKPWCASYWGGRPTEDWMFSQVYSEGATWNETKWSNEKFNKLLIEARAELDTVKRRQMYVEMQRICRDEGGALVPLFMAYVQAHTDKIATPEHVAANWELDGHREAERWWFV